MTTLILLTCISWQESVKLILCCRLLNEVGFTMFKVLGNRNFKTGEPNYILQPTTKDKYSTHLPAEISQQDEWSSL